MLSHRIVGYLYLSCGLFFLIFFAGKLCVQILFLLIGGSLVMQGLRLLSFDRAVYYYSQNYFNNQFKK